MKHQIAIIFTAFIYTSMSFANNECPTTPKISKNEILVGWITNERNTTQFTTDAKNTNSTSVGEFRIVAVIKNNKITETNGSSIQNGQQFWIATNPKRSIHLTSVSSFLDRMGDDHCVYYASINSKKYSRWSLFTSEPDNRFRTPNKKETKLFNQLNTTCIEQGDYPETKKHACTKPKLLAITDINNNNKPEFWATEPYTWDYGLTVWEYNGKMLIKVLEVCVGCSD